MSYDSYLIVLYRRTQQIKNKIVFTRDKYISHNLQADTITSHQPCAVKAMPENLTTNKTPSAQEIFPELRATIKIRPQQIPYFPLWRLARFLRMSAFILAAPEPCKPVM